jgi:hypothetical protein
MSAGRTILLATSVAVSVAAYFALRKDGLSFDDESSPRYEAAKDRLAKIAAMVRKKLAPGRRVFITASWTQQGDVEQVRTYRPDEWAAGALDASYLSSEDAARLSNQIWSEIGPLVETLRIEPSDWPVQLFDVVGV